MIDEIYLLEKINKRYGKVKATTKFRNRKSRLKVENIIYKEISLKFFSNTKNKLCGNSLINIIFNNVCLELKKTRNLTEVTVLNKISSKKLRNK